MPPATTPRSWRSGWTSTRRSWSRTTPRRCSPSATPTGTSSWWSRTCPASRTSRPDALTPRRPSRAPDGAGGPMAGDGGRPRSGGEVRPAGVGGLGAALGLLPVLLAAEGGEVEEVVRPAGRLEPPGVLGVGVEHPPVDLQEARPARHLERLVVREEVAAPRLVLGPVAEVVPVRRDALVDRHAVVVVERATERRVPGDVPPAQGLPALQLVQRRP